MNKITIIISITLLFSVFVPLKAENAMHFGLTAGLAIPNDKISQFYDDTRQRVDFDSLAAWGDYFLNSAANLGYTINLKFRVELSDYFTFVPSLGIARFNEGLYDLAIPFENTVDTAFAKFQSTANIVPVSIGINGYLFKSLVGVYATADLAYNYATYSYDIVVWENYPSIPISTSKTSSWVGWGVGAGVDINLKLLNLNIEAKYSTLNLIKSSSSEPTKRNMTLTLGVFF